MPLTRQLELGDLEKFKYIAPPEELLPILPTVLGKPNTKTIPQLLAELFDRKAQNGYILNYWKPYIMWCDPKNSELTELGFFDDPEIRCAKYAETSPSAFVKYEVTHFVLRIHQHQENPVTLEDFIACLEPYYKYFDSPEGQTKLTYWPKKLNIQNYKMPNIYLDKGKYASLRILPPHIIASLFVHTLPYLQTDKAVQEIESSLKFAMELSKCFEHEIEAKRFK